MHGEPGRQQRATLIRRCRQIRFGALHLPFLIKIGVDKPVMQAKSVPSSLENLPTINDAQDR